MTVSKYFHAVVTGPISLLKGMTVTLKYFFNPKRIVTEQYPENKATLKMHERFRGRVELIHDENGLHACTACGMCEKACPNASINVLSTKSLAGKKNSRQISLPYGLLHSMRTLRRELPLWLLKNGTRF